MSNDNICKFIPSAYSDNLSVSCFVLESNAEVMKREKLLDENKLILVIQGEGAFSVDGRSVLFSTGSLIFCFEGERFFVESHTEGCKYMYISFRGIRGDELFRRFGINVRNRIFENFGSLVPLWSESLSRASDQTIDLAAESILLYTFSRLYEGLTKESGIVSRMVQLSEERFTDPDLSLSAIADRLSYNAKYLSSVFKEKMGVGYSEYLTSLRIKFAISLFDHGIDSVKNVAALSGFKDPLYFSTVFKKATGTSPKDYRTPSRKEEE